MTTRRDGALRTDDDAVGRRVNGALAIHNRQYDIVQKMREKGRRMPLPDETLLPGWRSPETGEWVLPRLAECWPTAVEDRTILPDAAPVPVSLVLRDYQRAALAPWWRGARNGVVEAPCGSGKTAVGLVAVAYCPTPAVVLVHTKDLLRQWVERGEAVGLPMTAISDGAGPVEGRVVVATMQTVSQWEDDARAVWGRGFGLVVVDEAHHAPCVTMGVCLADLPGRWRIGLTATPTRSDGLTPWMFAHLGATVAVVDRKMLVGANQVLVPTVSRLSSGWTSPPDVDFVEMVSAACDDEKRTERVVGLAASRARAGRRVMVLTERKSHASVLAGLLTDASVATALVHGEVSAKQRESRLAAVDGGDARVLVATQVADEGLDIVGLDTLILAAPQRNAARLEQRVGRICRPMEGKPHPEVFDIVDDGEAGRMWASRRRVYAKLGCEIREGAW